MLCGEKISMGITDRKLPCDRLRFESSTFLYVAHTHPRHNPFLGNDTKGGQDDW